MYTNRNRNERSQTVVSPSPVPRLDYLPNWERTSDTEPAKIAGDLADIGPVQVVKGDQNTDVTLLPQARRQAEKRDATETAEVVKTPTKRTTKAPAKPPASTKTGDGDQGEGKKD